MLRVFIPVCASLEAWEFHTALALPQSHRSPNNQLWLQWAFERGWGGTCDNKHSVKVPCSEPKVSIV